MNINNGNPVKEAKSSLIEAHLRGVGRDLGPSCRLFHGQVNLNVYMFAVGRIELTATWGSKLRGEYLNRAMFKLHSKNMQSALSFIYCVEYRKYESPIMVSYHREEPTEIPKFLFYIAITAETSRRWFALKLHV